MKILLIEAYYGGSHKLWADQLKGSSKHDIEILSLPARHWKWRMEGAAIELANQLKSYHDKPDLILATSMLDLNFLKSNLPKGWGSIPCIYYMHENQLTYPTSSNDEDKKQGRDYHYGMIQFKSMLSADQVCFNSNFHKQEFFAALKKLLSRLPDYSPLEQMNQLSVESMVLNVGVRDPKLPMQKNTVPVVLWNHRWEYDKNPELFFRSLINIKEELDFKLIVLGSKARTYPKIFNEAQKELSSNIFHWGYVETEEEYLQLINQSDILPVTSNQDFFGISIIESILTGATPLLPNRLVYPEHFDTKQHKNLFYESEAEFHNKLKELIRNPIQETQKNSLINKAKEYLWSRQITYYDQLFESLKIE